MATRSTQNAGAPTVVGRYELIAPIVTGALGQLWQARIASGPEEGRVVDIRRIPRSERLDASHVERLTNAGFAAMELRHPRIAAVLDVVVAPAEIAIVSEHIDALIAQSLVRPQQGKRIAVPLGVASRIAIDLLEAVDGVQAPWAELFAPPDSDEDRLLKACVHGGMVPDGLLVASFGEAMLLETGLAGVALTIPAILDHPDVIAYRAPEQLEPGRVVDERADVFTVGILLWEMIAGRSLFGPSVMPRPGASPLTAKAAAAADAVQVSAARRRVLTHPIPRIDSLPLLKGNVPKALADAVARCLERDPELRFQSAREALAVFAKLDERALSPHAAVAEFVSSVGLTSVAEPLTEETPGPGSNRPTAPPVDEAASRPPTDVFGEGKTRPGTALRVARRSEGAATEPDGAATEPDGAATLPEGVSSDLPPSTDVESLPPSEPGTDMLVDAESDPPSSADLDTLPPLAAVLAAAEVPNVEASVTLQSGVAYEPDPNGIGEASLHAEDVKALARAREVDAVPGEETTSAPVVRPLEGARVPALGDSVLRGPADVNRRARSRKLVLAVMAAAALLMVIGLLRAVLSGGRADEARSVSSPAATRAVESAPAAPATASSSAAAAEARPPETAAKESPPPSVAPTSAPTGATTLPAESSARKQIKKRPYRPAGI